jgi:hypothetical protein
MNALKIFGPNLVDKYSSITVTDRDELKQYLYDQKPETYWQGGTASDLNAQTITITFGSQYVSGSVPCTFDRIILLNTNFKAITADYFRSGTWYSIPEASINVSSANQIIEITPVLATQVRITCTTTQIADNKKRLGEIKICESIFNGDQQWLSTMQRQDEQKSGAFRVGEGGLTAWKEWTKFAGSLTLFDVTAADHDTLLAYIKTPTFLTWIFYDDFDMAEIFEAWISNAPNHELDRKTQLYSQMSLELQEK